MDGTLYLGSTTPFFFFWPHYMTCRILVTRPGIEPRPSAVKCRLLTAGLPGNSLNIVFLRGVKVTKAEFTYSKIHPL